MVMKRGVIAAVLSLVFAGAFAVPAGVAGAAGTGTFRQENLVSDQPGRRHADRSEPGQRLGHVPRAEHARLGLGQRR